MNSIGERIAWARAQRGITQAQLAHRVGISQSAIGSYEAGHREKPRELVAIAAALEVYPEWLDSGRGPWAAPKSADFEVPSFSRSSGTREPAPAYGMTPILAWEHEADLPDGEFVMVPRLNVHLSAGGGRDQIEIELAEKTPIAFRADWIRKARLKPNKLAALSASGRSMEPTIHDGDSLIVDTSQTDVKDGQVYALWYEGGERVKRLYRMPGGGLRIRSDNAAEHPEIVLTAEYVGHVRIIGRVVHKSGSGGL